MQQVAERMARARATPSHSRLAGPVDRDLIGELLEVVEHALWQQMHLGGDLVEISSHFSGSVVFAAQPSEREVKLPTFNDLLREATEPSLFSSVDTLVAAIGLGAISGVEFGEMLAAHRIAFAKDRHVRAHAVEGVMNSSSVELLA